MLLPAFDPNGLCGPFPLLLQEAHKFRNKVLRPERFGERWSALEYGRMLYAGHNRTPMTAGATICHVPFRNLSPVSGLVKMVAGRAH